MVKIIQISVGGFDNNFSYLVLGEGKHAKSGVLIDPTGNKESIELAIKKAKARIVLQLFTHAHPDHTELFEHFGSLGVKAFFPKPAALGKTKLVFAAGLEITALHTPGHTKESVCFIIKNNLFSGDTLFVGGVGTTAYGGDEKVLKETLNFLATLNPGMVLWPGHNYGGACSTLKTALKNSHITPGEKVLRIIKNKVADYESKSKAKTKFKEI